MRARIPFLDVNRGRERSRPFPTMNSKASSQRRCWIFPLILIAAVLAARTAAADVPEVKSAADRTTAKIGDHITYTITVKAAKDVNVELPKIEAVLGKLTVKDVSYKESVSFGKKTMIQRIILTTYEPGKYTIPRLAVKYKKKDQDKWSEAQTSEAAIEVKSVLEGAKGVLDIRDIKGPVDKRARASRIMITAAVLAVLALLAWALARVIRKKRSEQELPKPPHVIAYEALEALARMDLIRQGKIKEYYIALSDIVRHYLENRFDLRAPEMTTEEFLINAKENEDLTREQKDLLKDFMSNCDLVKFAKYGPTQDETESATASARRLVDQTKQEKDQAK